jgi:hypothetical protein
MTCPQAGSLNDYHDSIPISSFFIKIKISRIYWFTINKNIRGLTFGADRYHLLSRSVRLASDCGVLRICCFFIKIKIQRICCFTVFLISDSNHGNPLIELKSS